MRVSSVLEDGDLQVATLGFGGDRSLPTNTREDVLEVSNELSFLFRDQHRVKLGGLVNHTSFEQRSAFNRLGSFEFNSLEDFEAGRPSQFTRTLTPRTTEGGGVNAAVYLGDTWRPTQRLQLTFGARAEVSRFDDRPEPMAVLDLKGRFTELNPAFSKLVGYREHQFAKATWPSVLDRNQYKAQVAEMEALIAGERDVVAVRSTYMHGQGLMVPIQGEVRLLRDASGEPSGLLMTADNGG